MCLLYSAAQTVLQTEKVFTSYPSDPALFVRCLFFSFFSRVFVKRNVVMWKSMVKRQYPDAVDYARFMGKYSR